MKLQTTWSNVVICSHKNIYLAVVQWIVPLTPNELIGVRFPSARPNQIRLFRCDYVVMVATQTVTLVVRVRIPLVTPKKFFISRWTSGRSVGFQLTQAGSIPVRDTKFWADSDNGSTPRLHRGGRGSIPRWSTKIKLQCDGREAQCSGLQIRKTVGSNPTRTSNLYRRRTLGVHLTVDQNQAGSIPVGGASFRFLTANFKNSNSKFDLKSGTCFILPLSYNGCIHCATNAGMEVRFLPGVPVQGQTIVQSPAQPSIVAQLCDSARTVRSGLRLGYSRQSSESSQEDSWAPNLFSSLV